ncbi:6-phosphogluconolactonase [Pseudomonas sp. UL073]|uniref:6-phosphogluconolactonase n=1 Tax=Zestomonas insulae TaxID=2809017 RepID=A0ABS2ID25_9GAMM|nr:6-phosphogluconolactonase [Pseudomonas insulae]
MQHLAADLGQQLRQTLAARPRARLLLPGGSSPQVLLPLLREQALDWPRIDLSPTDERWVAADDPHSNWRLLQQGLPHAHCLDPRQDAQPEAAALVWAQQLETWRRFDAVLLGMGEDGHFASLFPGMPNLAAALDPATPAGALVGMAPSAPHQRLSLNLSMLCDSDWLGLLAFGDAKRALLEATLSASQGSRELPLQALLDNAGPSLTVYWAP